MFFLPPSAQINMISASVRHEILQANKELPNPFSEDNEQPGSPQGTRRRYNNDILKGVFGASHGRAMRL